MIIQTADRIKEMRLRNNLTQTELARKLYVTRACVNAWEMAVSVPSTEKIMSLCQILHVSSDYLLGLSSSEVIPIDHYNADERELLYKMVHYFDEIHKFGHPGAGTNDS